jgi:adenylate kinase
VASGDLYRAAIAAGSDLGLLVAPLLDAGELVPDDITIPLIRDEVSKVDGGFVLDGYPRTLAQAEALDELLDDVVRPLDIVLLLELSDQTAVERLIKRAESEGRADDQHAAIDRRLRDYHEKTEPVVEHYRATGKLVNVHAERPIDDVWAEIADALETVQARA